MKNWEELACWNFSLRFSFRVSGNVVVLKITIVSIGCENN